MFSFPLCQLWQNKKFYFKHVSYQISWAKFPKQSPPQSECSIKVSDIHIEPIKHTHYLSHILHTEFILTLMYIVQYLIIFFVIKLFNVVLKLLIRNRTCLYAFQCNYHDDLQELTFLRPKILEEETTSKKSTLVLH